MSCVVIYQIHNIAGYGNSIYSPFVDAAVKSKGQVEYYKIHKRQVDPEQYRRCQGTKLSTLVTEGSHKNVLSTFLAIRCVLCMLVGIYVLTHTRPFYHLAMTSKARDIYIAINSLYVPLIVAQ